MSAPLDFLYRPKWYLFPINKPNVVDVYIELTATSHSTFSLSFGDGAPCYSSTRNDDRILELDVFEHVEINAITCLLIGRREVPRQPQLDWSCIFKAERKRLLERYRDRRLWRRF